MPRYVCGPAAKFELEFWGIPDTICNVVNICLYHVIGIYLNYVTNIYLCYVTLGLFTPLD
jgi:hypothetical protein